MFHDFRVSGLFVFLVSGLELAKCERCKWFAGRPFCAHANCGRFAFWKYWLEKTVTWAPSIVCDICWCHPSPQGILSRRYALDTWSFAIIIIIIIMIHHRSSRCFIMRSMQANHAEAWWLILMHHDESLWCIIMIPYGESSWYIVMTRHDASVTVVKICCDESPWIVLHHDESSGCITTSITKNQTNTLNMGM